MPVVSKIRFEPFPDYTVIFPVNYTTKLGRFTISLKDTQHKQAVIHAVTAAMLEFDSEELEKAKCTIQVETGQLVSADEEMLYRVMSVALTCYRKTERVVDKIILVGTTAESPINFSGTELDKIVGMSNFSSDKAICWDIQVGVYERESFAIQPSEASCSYRFLRDHRIKVFGVNIADDFSNLKWELKSNSKSIIVIPYTENNAQVVSKWIESKLSILMGMCIQNTKVRNELLTAVGLPAVKQKMVRSAKKVVTKTTKSSIGNPKGKRREPDR